MLSKLYKKRFPGVQVVETDSDTSELIKLSQNSFFATKITFFNELYQLCSRLGVSYNQVLAGLLADGRIAQSHTQVPGPDGQLGFGGECLPKDLFMFDNEFSRRGLVSHLCSAVIDSNLEVKRS